jgi:aerobic carbon-monoxide dehydrogenase large subunit
MTKSLVGHPQARSEDAPLLTGEARFVEDLVTPPALHAVFVRSYLAHARILDVEVGAASARSGVEGVFVAGDLNLAPLPAGDLGPALARPPLARDVVRFVGEPVAVVLARSQAQAVDAAEAVIVDYEELPVVLDAGTAGDPTRAVLFPRHGSNVVFEHGPGGGDALLGADVVVRRRVVNQRVAPVPLEVNSILATPANKGLDVAISAQAPFSIRRDIAAALGLDRSAVRVAVPAVGGAFGAKIATYPEHIVVAALALRMSRPVAYTETRSESMVAMTHGRAQIQDVAVGARRDGRLTGLEVSVIADCGAYPDGTLELVELTELMATGTYRIPSLSYSYSGVVTNKTPIAAYRGAGRPEATALIERAVDLVAAELGLDPVAVRRKNLIGRSEFPYTAPSGALYDSGDYQHALNRALELARYDRYRREQSRRRTTGSTRLLGIGVSCYVEVTGGGSEWASVTVNEAGAVVVGTGTSPHGQGHETSWAQIVGDALRVPFERVRVVHSDTTAVAKGGGTMGSRSLQVGGSAVVEAATRVLRHAKEVAARTLEVAVDDLVHNDDGTIGVVGVPERALDLAELAALAGPQGLSVALDYRAESQTYPFGCHVSIVEVDAETGHTRLLRHIAVDDSGMLVNPLLAEGQVHGGLAQGIGQAVFEVVLHDSEGNPLNANLAAYGLPGATELPRFETERTQTRSPVNALGVKGIGESGAIGAPPAVQNAVIDALAHLGVRHIDMPLTPERVWRAIPREVT